MLSLQRIRRNRECTGPTPNSVAIIEKMPTKILPEHLTLERRRIEDLRDSAIQLTRYNKLAKLKNDWEGVSDRAIQKNTVQRRVEQILEENAVALEEKRTRLHALLAEEEEGYIREIEERHETTAERQEKMREKAKVLKEKREKERQKIVQQKLDECWRNQCEELRGVISRRHQDEVCIDRMHQLSLKLDLEQMRQEEEKMYAQLWEKDRLMKAAKEERDSQEQNKRNKAMVEILQTQSAALKAKKMEEERLMQEEARLLQEERELRAMEEERSRQNKRRQQLANKNALDKSIKLKRRRAAQERQEELALDMKLIQQLLEESTSEVKEDLENKRKMRDEYKRYKEYLAEMKKEEARRDAVVDRLLEKDVEKTWQQKIARWKMEKEARNQLMREVMKSRKEQLHMKLVAMAKEKEALVKEREKIAKFIAEHNRLDEERDARTKEINKKYEADLLGQIAHQKQLKQQKLDQEWKEYKDGLEAEAAYQEKLIKVLASTEAHGRIHPSRRVKPTLNPSVTEAES